ncbi:MAG TPA: hypothetical protein VKR60_14845 [Candidatus Sulfotelmatobacter sp.]|nr:hypothetical protein [Candidatus Sulfotelmatobacter sp.]
MKISLQLTTACVNLCLAACLIPLHTVAQDTKATDTKSPAAKTTQANAVPVIDGGIGNCAAAFTVTDESAAPVYDAKIRVHIAYGFMYLRKMDLEVGTDTNGKARFEGLPARTKIGLNFQASKADREGTAFVDPSTTCKADLNIVLHQKPQ